MATKILGARICSDEATIVSLTKQDGGDFTLENQAVIKLQEGDRPAAYDVFHGQFCDFITHEHVSVVCILGSIVSRSGTKLGHLHAAELRGVAQAAAATAGVEVRIINKATVSRTFGERNVDEYVSDDGFWARNNLAELKKGWRLPAFAVISQFS